MARVSIKDNTNSIKSDTKLKSSIFLRRAVEDIKKISEPNTPKKTGALRNNVLRQVLGLKGKIVWQQDYAIYQEKKQYRNYTTAGTGPRYAENAVRQVVDNTEIIAREVSLIK